MNCRKRWDLVETRFQHRAFPNEAFRQFSLRLAGGLCFRRWGSWHFARLPLWRFHGDPGTDVPEINEGFIGHRTFPFKVQHVVQELNRI